MFADLSGFTAMSERLEPEEVTALMNECFEMMGSIIQFYGGVIDKFIGDCVMAVFGAPQAIENAPVKAVNAAIELRRGVLRFREQRGLGEQLDLHIGLNTGLVLAGQVGARDQKQYTVIGDAVNLASRLEDLSKRGQILVGPATYHATRLDFEYSELGPVEIKGKAKPVQVYLLESVQEKMHRGTPWKQRQVHSELVGRSSELGLLRERVTALQGGQGGVVLVEGEAGIGKSRLLAELRAGLAADGLRYHEGRAVSIGRNLSFHPLVDLLRNLADIVEDDEEAVASGKLDRVVTGLLGERSGGELLPFLLTLMGLQLPPGQRDLLDGVDSEALEKLLLRSMRELLQGCADARPTLICLEDLHWADGSTLTMLEGVLSLASTHPLLFVLLYRPGYADTSGRLAASGASLSERCTLIELQRLGEEHASELLDRLIPVKGLPPATRDLILRRADGNPFFVEEVVRSMVDQGAVVMRDGRFEITERIHQVDVPTSINDVIMARIDRLEPDARELLRTASVLGRRFFRRILKEVLDTPLDTDEHLRVLTESQFLQEQIHMQELEYLFKHALAQEVAYQSLLIERRRQLHLRVARSIERVFAARIADFYGMLAYHYSCGEDLGKAGHYMELAGREAARCSASIEALSYFEQALALYSRKSPDALDSEALVALHEATGRAYFARGHHVEAIQHFERVLPALGRRVSRSRPWLLLRFGLGMLRLARHLWAPSTLWKVEPDPLFERRFAVMVDYLRALGTVEAGMLALTAPELPCCILDVGVERVERGVELLSTSAVGFCWTGASITMSARILAVVRASPVDDRQALYLRFGQVIHGFVAGDWDQPYDRQVVDRGFGKGELWHTCTLLVFWVYIAIEQGRFDDAHSMLEQMQRAGDAFNDHFARSLHQQARSMLLLAQRRLLAAVDAADLTIGINVENGQEGRNLSLYGLRARAKVLGGQLDSAALCIERARVLRSRQHRVVPFHYSNLLTAEALLAVAQLAAADDGRRPVLGRAALQAIRRARRNARKVASAQVEAQRLEGLALALLGKPERAVVQLEGALARAEALGAVLEAARTRSEAGQVLAGQALRVAGEEPAALLARGRRELAALGVEERGQPWWALG